MHDRFDDYWYPQQKTGPVMQPPGLMPPPPKPHIEPAFGPVPCPPGTQEEIKPLVPPQGPRPPILAPIPHRLPPKHTQVQPRCFTCRHFKMCSFKKDYLKTITLVQNILGAPQADYELTNKYITIPDFVGFPLVHAEKYLPEEVVFDNTDKKGKLFLAKFNGINYVNAVYLEFNHYILIQLKYNKDSDLYDLTSCQEAFYGVKYDLNKDSLEEMQLGLIEWREKIINAVMPPPPPRKDVINTTHFSAMLNCDMYEWNKETFEEAVERMKREYPFGIPIDEKGHGFYHIATFHVANGEVPYSPLIQEKPYFPPKPPKPPKPAKRYGDM